MKGNLLEQRKPPVALVRTWVHLINSSESEEVINRASRMLHNSFCNIHEAVQFCREQDIKN